MPSNKQYTDQAHELAAELGVDVTTDGLSNDKLAELVSELKAKKAEAEEEAEEEAAATRPPYSVAPGKALTTKRGIIGEGDEITAEHLTGGQKALDAFVKSGHVVKA